MFSFSFEVLSECGSVVQLQHRWLLDLHRLLPSLLQALVAKILIIVPVFTQLDSTACVMQGVIRGMGEQSVRCSYCVLLRRVSFCCAGRRSCCMVCVYCPASCCRACASWCCVKPPRRWVRCACTYAGTMRVDRCGVLVHMLAPCALFAA